MRSFRIILVLWILIDYGVISAQPKLSNEIVDISELKGKLSTAKTDSARLYLYENIAFSYEVINIDSAFKYVTKGLALARKIKDPFWEGRLLGTMSGLLAQRGDLAEAIKVLFEYRQIAQENNFPGEVARSYRRLGGIYLDLEEYNKALSYFFIALNTDKNLKRATSVLVNHMGISNVYASMGKYDSALYHGKIAEAMAKEISIPRFIQETDNQLGKIYFHLGNDSLAFYHFSKSFHSAKGLDDFRTSADAALGLSKIYSRKKTIDSAIYFATSSYESSKYITYRKGIYNAALSLTKLYDSSNALAAINFYKIAAAANDSLFGTSNIKAIQGLINAEDERQRQIDDIKKSYLNKIRLYSLSGVILIATLLLVFLYRNNRIKQRSNIQLNKQKTELQETLNKLTMTQSQLIHSEKMASLGELTAGIAHEIQNPLNFVNNFSEVNSELIAELRKELADGNKQSAEEIVSDIESNSKKINEHGKRADGIVKSMLQHSQKSAGQKELTDINVLCDEYLRLSYHGFRAKDKSFNSKFETNFDPTQPKVKVVPQDIGRVVLNLINNAFYAVNEKAKQNMAGYEPAISITTKSEGGKVLISINDNGNGIPDAIKQKIFQPFFTTKPTGQGTGLGLSLSYDIVKAHGGELTVSTKETEGSIFIIKLPL